jgi:hypothetical protein
MGRKVPDPLMEIKKQLAAPRDGAANCLNYYRNFLVIRVEKHQVQR